MEILKYIPVEMKLLFHWFIMVLVMILTTTAFHVAELAKEDTFCSGNKYEKILNTLVLP